MIKSKTLISQIDEQDDNTDASYMVEKQVERHDEAETSLKQQSSEMRKSSTKELQVSLEGLIPVNQLKEVIMETIKDKIDRSSKSSMTYTKLYAQRIDNTTMSVSYQPSKFQQFDDKSNSKQHVAHIIETCNSAGTYEDHLVK
ncbi:hypothetical protein Sango_0376200 [Sesamum angolense]|uniref:Ty3-gypsy retrotransposon protein n=1 Tax=Sesamum angolense TaxID=2727404 RepID=A0AAE1XAM5_9LAMI|nr:hypothetical protein Sango_0376200 [Sesamum angolense]